MPNYTRYTDRQLDSLVRHGSKASREETKAINAERFKRKLLKALEKGATLSGPSILQFKDDPRFTQYITAHQKQIEHEKQAIKVELERIRTRQERLV